MTEEKITTLEEAAEEYRKESYRKSVLPNIDGPMPEYGGSIKDAFIAGAEWQKKQNTIRTRYKTRLDCYEQGRQDMREEMLKDAVEGFIFQSADYYPKQLIASYDGELGMGDKVKIIIVKEGKE